VVIGNAITRGNPEVEEVLNRWLYYLALPEVLKQFSCAAAKIWSSLGRTEKQPRPRC
jgi:UDP-N-acetylmuramate-alanine ligase